MAGGTFVSQNKVRPGVYINIESKELNVGAVNSGIVTIPLDLNWGAEQAVKEIDKDTNTLPIFGALLEDIIPLREALKRATKIFS